MSYSGHVLQGGGPGADPGLHEEITDKKHELEEVDVVKEVWDSQLRVLSPQPESG